MERIGVSLRLEEVVPVRGIGGIGRDVETALKHRVRDERLPGTIPGEALYRWPVRPLRGGRGIVNEESHTLKDQCRAGRTR